MRRTLSSSILSFVLVAVVAVAAAMPSGAQTAPVVVVTPSTDLVEGQVVQVAGEGFLPSSTVVLVICPPGATNGLECDIGTLPMAVTDSTGAFSTSFTIRRYILESTDCAEVTCSIGVGDVAQTRTAMAPIHLADLPDPVPALTASVGPTGTAVIEATGFRPNTPYPLRQCPEGAVALSSCDYLRETLRTDDTGGRTITLAVRADVLVVEDGVPELHDCRTEACVLVYGTGSTTASAPLDLAAVTHPSPVASVTPSGPIDDLTELTLTTSGFGGSVNGRTCAMVLGGLTCPTYPEWSLGLSPTGGHVGSVVARRDVVVDHEGPLVVDCAIDACVLLAEGVAPASSFRQRILFPLPIIDGPRPAVDPVVTVTVGEDGASVTGSGFPLGGAYGVFVCATGGAPCAWVDEVTPDGAGTFSLAEPIPRFPADGSEVDCLHSCIVQLRVISEIYAWSAPFSSAPPQLGITVAPMGTVDTAGRAVASATITCDSATDVSVTGTVAQVGTSGGFTFVDRCTPETPLLAFVPTRTFTTVDTTLTAGPAEVTITATADVPGDPEPVVATGSTVLVDEATVEQAVALALQEPGADELRAVFLRSLAARVRQDPVFAQELFHALFGGG